MDTLSTLSPTVTTDLLDYAPSSTATITAENFIIGSTLEFQVLHVIDSGGDGIYGTLDDVLGDNSGDGHDAWYVTDGVRTAGADGVVGTADDQGDLDGVADGNITTTWYVNPDDSIGETFLLSATDEATGQVASSSFTDSPYFIDTVPATAVDLTTLGAEATVTHDSCAAAFAGTERTASASRATNGKRLRPVPRCAKRHTKAAQCFSLRSGSLLRGLKPRAALRGVILIGCPESNPSPAGAGREPVLSLRQGSVPRDR